MTVRILTGDCREILPTLGANSVDAVVCDPPYDLTAASRNGSPRQNDPSKPFGRHNLQPSGGFMGKQWDATGVAFDPATWDAVKRVLKPGAFLLAFGGTRTIHRMICAIEDVGFEIRDQIVYMYGSGFPKSLNLGDGRGTALKPAHEPIVVARKPLIGTVAANVEQYGTGALNIDATRIGTTPEEQAAMLKHSESFAGKRWGDTHFNYGYEDSMPIKTVSTPHASGRWPANVILAHSPSCVEIGTKRVKGHSIGSRGGERSMDFGMGSGSGHDYTDPDGYETVAAWECAPDCAVRLLDEQSGTSGSSGGRIGQKSQSVVANVPAGQYRAGDPGYGDTGGASRFFYTAKASQAERTIGGAPSTHPTVKPLSLMTWLVRLVTPNGGIVLDPFAGSGSTLIAADRAGFDAIGIELDPEYAEIARRRVTGDAPLFANVEVA